MSLGEITHIILTVFSMALAGWSLLIKRQYKDEEHQYKSDPSIILHINKAKIIVKGDKSGKRKVKR